MNIVMMTNTFTPHVGGVARSIEQFSEHYRQLGHNVLVVAPEFDDMPVNETGVIRIPAIRHFNHTDFSVIRPVPHFLQQAIDDFAPDIVHSHHPFLVGSIALRVAHTSGVPLVFTHHTKYEDYTHNLSIDTEQIKKFAMSLATNYANTCDQIFAPSDSIRQIIQKRGVKTPIDVVPTGVDMPLFANANGRQVRKSLGIPDNAFVVGHLGRITKEKNIRFLIESVVRFLRHADTPENACFMICGDGPLLSEVDQLFANAGLENRLFKVGIIEKPEVPNAFSAMDVFAFTSKSETQGMVITEAMATGRPVVAVDAPGVRDVVVDNKNGLLLSESCSQSDFADALKTVADFPEAQYQRMSQQALNTADVFSMSNSAKTAMALYTKLVESHPPQREEDFAGFTRAVHLFESEWQILKNTLKAAADSIA